MEIPEGLDRDFLVRNCPFTLKEVDGELIVSLQDVFAKGKLFCTQDWIKESDITTAERFNQGDQSPELKYQRFPEVYWGLLNGQVVFIVGDGHHRTADSLYKGYPLYGSIDLKAGSLGDIGIALKDKVKGQIKYAKFGIEGVWPFANFLERFINKIKQIKKSQTES